MMFARITAALVAGFASDIQWMTGNACGPYRNLRDPFAAYPGRGPRTFRIRAER